MMYTEKTKLSQHFSLGEAVASLTADARSLWNWPGQEQIDNLFRLFVEFEKVRKLCGGYPMYTKVDLMKKAPVQPYGIISSCYRSKEVNTAVGGQPASAHMEGRAIDFIPPEGEDLNAIQQMIGTENDIEFDRVLEEQTVDGKSHWLHFQIAKLGETGKRLIKDIDVQADGTLRTVDG